MSAADLTHIKRYSTGFRLEVNWLMGLSNKSALIQCFTNYHYWQNLAPIEADVMGISECVYSVRSGSYTSCLISVIISAFSTGIYKGNLKKSSLLHSLRLV